MRGLVRLTAALAGLVVAAVGGLLVVEVVAGWLAPGATGVLQPWLQVRSALTGLSWNQMPVLVTAAVVAVVGVLLLVLSSSAGREEIRMEEPAPLVTVTTDPNSVARLVGHRVQEDEAVSSASVSATRKRVRVRAVGRYTQIGDARSRLVEAARSTVSELPLQGSPRVSVSMSPAKEKP